MLSATLKAGLNGYDIGAQGFTVIDASRPLDEVAAECLKRVRTA
jgi:hypothetical protein